MSGDDPAVDLEPFERHLSRNAGGVPLAVLLTGGNRNDVARLIPLLQAIPPIRGKRGRPRRRAPKVYADRGYDHDKYRAQVRDLGITPVIVRRGIEHGSGSGTVRWVVEQTFALLHWFRRLRIRWEIRDDIHEALLKLGCALICWRRLHRSKSHESQEFSTKRPRVEGERVLGVVAAALGGPEVLQVTELPEPEAGPGQVVVRIRAVCVHPADVAATTGEIPRGPVLPPFSPGWDIAGEVASVGPDTAEFRVGDRVVGMIPWYLTRGAPGGYAEFVAADADWLVPLPDELDFVSAATVPLNAQTAHQGLSLVSSAMLAAGSSILVTGAGGGVGGFAVQLAAQGGYRVLAQAGHGDEQWVHEIGAHEVVSRSADLGAGTTSARRGLSPYSRPVTEAPEQTRPSPPPGVAAGVLFVDDQERVLLLRTTYKPYWEISGGYIEPAESPLDACVREVQEEIGLHVAITRLLVIDWAPHPDEGDKMLFVFEGSSLRDDQVASIRFQDGEIDEWAFVDRNRLGEFTIPRLAGRIRQALTARREQRTVFLQQGLPAA